MRVKTHGARALCNLAACRLTLARALRAASSSTPARGSPHRSPEQGGIHRSDSKSTVRRPRSQRPGMSSPRWSPSTQVESQYLVQHLTHRGAVWASGAAQAAHVVRIILRWRGVAGVFRCVFWHRRRQTNRVYTLWPPKPRRDSGLISSRQYLPFIRELQSPRHPCNDVHRPDKTAFGPQ